MRTYDANYWEVYHPDYPKSERKKTKRSKAADRKLKLAKYNRQKKEIAEDYAETMQREPSILEQRMQQLLSTNGIKYQFQKIFYVRKKNEKISRFFIADFYIPEKNIIIETDGAFHNQQVEKDTLRTEMIQKQYPNIKVLRWRWHDFGYSDKVAKLLSQIK